VGQVFSKAFAGGLAGLAAWLIWEPQFPASPFDPEWQRTETLFLATLGALIGLAVNGLSGYAQGSRAHLLRGLGAGFCLGLLGGLLGHQVGGGLAMAIFGPGIFADPGFSPVQIVARIVAFVPMGLAVGAALGAAGLSWRRLWAGATGGAIGAGAAGALFDPIGMTLGGLIMAVQGGAEVGIVSRAVLAMGMGVGIGLFTGVLDRATQTAWVRLALARNEYREWPVDAAVTVLGRSETAHVPLFGDPNVAPQHAGIARQAGGYILADYGSPMGTGLNGQRVREAHLTSGDVIQIGRFQLQFVTRSGRMVRTPDPVAYQPQPLPQQPGAQPVGPAPMPAATYPAAAQAYPQAPVVPTSQAVAQAPPRPTLVAVGGPLTGQRFAIVAPMEVGREAPGIPMSFDNMVSRRHARFEPAPGGAQVIDLGSTNGTIVNGQRVHSQTLRPGDTVQIGGTTFRLELA
jgi:pSer/pThr/pTyr-binding forkhead associated (FHA) protein